MNEQFRRFLAGTYLPLDVAPPGYNIPNLDAQGLSPQASDR